jgi:hypothetical protein
MWPGVDFAQRGNVDPASCLGVRTAVKGAASRRIDRARDIALQQMQTVQPDPIEEGDDELFPLPTGDDVMDLQRLATMSPANVRGLS